MIVAIDGPSGVGKSTVARRLAARLGIPYLETGAMYRALGLKVVMKEVDPDDREAVARLAAELDLELQARDDGRVEVLLDGELLGERVRAAEVSEVTSRVSAYPEVRRRMVGLQRALAGEQGAVLEGRDIGTKVFPATPHKFFLTAPVELRVARRLQQLQESGQTELTIEDVQKQVAQRDYRDTNRADSPLVQDATYTEVDTGGLTIDEVVEEIAHRIGEARKDRGQKSSADD